MLPLFPRCPTGPSHTAPTWSPHGPRTALHGPRHTCCTPRMAPTWSPACLLHAPHGPACSPHAAAQAHMVPAWPHTPVAWTRMALHGPGTAWHACHKGSCRSCSSLVSGPGFLAGPLLVSQSLRPAVPVPSCLPEQLSSGAQGTSPKASKQGGLCSWPVSVRLRVWPLVGSRFLLTLGTRGAAFLDSAARLSVPFTEQRSEGGGNTPRHIESQSTELPQCVTSDQLHSLMCK